MMERILGFLLFVYILYGFGFAIGLKDNGANFLTFLIVIAFWPFFKGLNDGDAV